jgi:glycosyltransferase involved in cell wall biosynthesis
MKVFDSRWEGQHGIGRFALEIGRRLSGFARISLSGSPSDAIDCVRLTRYLRSLKPQLYFSPGYNAPLGAPCPFVVTVHDLNHLAVRENSRFLKRFYYANVLKPALHRARIVLTVSNFSRECICRWSGLSDSRVWNVGNGVSQVFVPATSAPIAAVRRYFLYVGNHKPHKNFIRLLQAFARSRLEDYSLVSTGTSTPALQQQIASLNLDGRVTFVGQISDEDLALLYQGATALVLVSLYEGFGLPLVEAMSCGTPVITSNVASMPEVAGDAGLQVSPYDIGAIADALIRLSNDRDLRQVLRARGLERARLYTWDATAASVDKALAACV